MNIPVFGLIIITTLYIIIILNVYLKKNRNEFDNKYDELIEKERKANLTTMKKINDDIFVTPNINKLPFKDYMESEKNKIILAKQNVVKRKSELKMIHFKEKISNTDLKLKYGINNLENITMYEEHFNSYIRALTEWADELIKREEYKDAENILIESINFGSDLSLSYTLLADIYKLQNDKDKLNSLKDKVNSSNVNLKQKILNYIES